MSKGQQTSVHDVTAEAQVSCQPEFDEDTYAHGPYQVPHPSQSLAHKAPHGIGIIIPVARAASFGREVTVPQVNMATQEAEVCSNDAPVPVEHDI